MNQRRLMGAVSALLLAAAVLTVNTGVPAVRGQTAMPQAVTAPAPDWSFVVHGMQDPYVGTVANPGEPAPGMRFVGFDVEVVNASDQPLSFADNAVVLRDDENFSYHSGTVVGREPALSGRPIPVGQRARGWVWFEVPEGATLTEILLVPAAPELRVGLDKVASIPGTPGSGATAAGITPSPAATATQPVIPAVTALATEPPLAAATSTSPPAAPQAPTSVITIESAETPDGTVAATMTPRATSTSGATATPAIVISAPTSTPLAESGIEPGSTVVNAESDANLRAGPSLAAEIVDTIPLGSELVVTGPSVSGDDVIWWPVTVSATGEEGYVADELLIPAEAE